MATPAKRQMINCVKFVAISLYQNFIQDNAERLFIMKYYHRLNNNFKFASAKIFTKNIYNTRAFGYRVTPNVKWYAFGYCITIKK